MLTELNRHYGIGESVVFVDGNGKLPKAILRDASGHELEVYLYGSTITAWKTPKGRDLLYLSPKADFSGEKPIRGGIPLVFPQFGGGPLPSHGFIRINQWLPKKSAALPSGEVELVLGLSDSEKTRSLWPYAFEVELIMRLSSKLVTTFRVTNKDKKEFAFQNALHTYFAINDLSKVEVTPLKGLTFLDSTKNREANTETREKVVFSSETDRVYVKAPNTLTIRDYSLPLTISITKHNMQDAVVWNPWIDRCKAIPDFAPDSFQKFVCVESGNVAETITVKPGQTWECRQEIGYV